MQHALLEATRQKPVVEHLVPARSGRPLPQAANANLPATAGAHPLGATFAVRRIAVVAWLAIGLGFAMQGLVLASKLAVGAPPLVSQVFVDLAQGITWSFFVCAGVGLGTTIARANVSLGGLVGMISAPLAMGLAKGSQKFMASALGAIDKPAVLPLASIAIMRAIEYGLLGWALAWLATRGEKRAWPFLLAGTATGAMFGGTMTGLTVMNAEQKAIDLPAAAVIATAVNEIVFPIGCALVVYIALQVGRHIKLINRS